MQDLPHVKDRADRLFQQFEVGRGGGAAGGVTIEGNGGCGGEGGTGGGGRRSGVEVIGQLGSENNTRGEPKVLGGGHVDKKGVCAS